MPKLKEAQARIKINKLLEEAGWRFFDDKNGKANIICEDRITKKTIKVDSLGNDFEHTTNGFADYILLDSNGEPIAVIEAKKESIDPLSAIDQAKEYAQYKRVKHIFLSNGDHHYYWHTHEMSVPQPVSHFLNYKELGEVEKWQPHPELMANMNVDENYIAISQDGQWLTYNIDTKERERKDKGIRILRNYQVEALKTLQNAYCRAGKRRFLFEMATGTGKTLLSAAVIKLFLRAGCAKRVLFLVDRIELEKQAQKSFEAYFKNDSIKSVIYKSEKRDWRNFDIVVTTIQSLSTNSNYRRYFNPSDFQLIISDEAHRTISGSNRAIFEYFIGAKLGLTATPKNYLKGIDVSKLANKDPRQLEERQLKDTYKTFGCEDGKPTFSFNLLDGVKAGVLCNPFVIDARTDITTEMLSEQGFTYTYTDEEGEEQEGTYFKKDYEKKFTSEETNRTFVRTFLQNAKKDPLTGEIGKTILFAVSRKHATKIVQILNEEIEKIYPKRYIGYTFAKQITSDLLGSQEYTTKFDHDSNNLEGKTKFNPAFLEYHSSKTRVCVTVAMMTTGYDCQDLLNVVLCRPIMSPTEFVQIKGRGTRLYDFTYNKGNTPVQPIKKDNFFLFDFFANYEYFEKDFEYDKKLELPKPKNQDEKNETVGNYTPPLEYTGSDDLSMVQETEIGSEGMRIDREMFPSERFEEKTREEVYANPELKQALEEENWDLLIAFVKNEIFDKPKEFWNVDKLCEAYQIDRRLSVREILMKVFGKIDHFKTRTDLADEEFGLFLTTITDEKAKAKYEELKSLFYSYLLYGDIREAINDKKMGMFATDNRLTQQELKALGKELILFTKNYIADNVILNSFQEFRF
jgi:type I restriction enzyme R subunit